MQLRDSGNGQVTALLFLTEDREADMPCKETSMRPRCCNSAGE